MAQYSQGPCRDSSRRAVDEETTMGCWEKDDVGGDEQVTKSEGGVTEGGQGLALCLVAGGCSGADRASALIRQQTSRRRSGLAPGMQVSGN